MAAEAAGKRKESLQPGGKSTQTGGQKHGKTGIKPEKQQEMNRKRYPTKSKTCHRTAKDRPRHCHGEGKTAMPDAGTEQTDWRRLGEHERTGEAGRELT